MINLNEIIEITATLYKPQFDCKTYRYHNSTFYATVVHLKDMYLNKYATKGYYIDKQSFKVVVC